ncbi:PorP/SprF family type IX secretion system membrane protein [Robertkochia flava]|uniref:PorP/SprF family type IX secretion system membrane protein n=1 Tax=Robertkochia flava TaxID=3447986 RepID=UPI001CCD1351|nr:type IX secretion system membrane protein PorP/SprF [Robertkochia marina]
MRILFTTILLLLGWLSFAQQLPQFTQYMYNTISINPAYAGSRESLSVVALHRSQWSGFEGGPQTLTASVHSPLRNDRIGLGLSFINDQLGFENFSYVYGDFSYSIQTGASSELAFGLKAGITQFALDQAFINDPDVSGDPFFRDLSNRVSPNIGAGIYWHSYRWYVGISAPRLFINNYNRGNSSLNQDFVASERVSYYFTGGLVFDLSQDIKLKPSILVKATNGAEAALDTSMNLLFFDRLWLGASYRWNDAIGAIADFQVTKAVRIGYAYDFAVSELRPYTDGSHEIFLLVDLSLKNPKFKSPRYF